MLPELLLSQSCNGSLEKKTVGRLSVNLRGDKSPAHRPIKINYFTGIGEDTPFITPKVANGICQHASQSVLINDREEIISQLVHLGAAKDIAEAMSQIYLQTTYLSP